MRFRLKARPARARERQRLFPFRERKARLERAFKGAIVVLTIAALAGLAGGSPAGRYAVTSLALRAKWAAMRPLKLERSRADIAADWRVKRELEVQRTESAFRRVYGGAGPRLRALLQDAGLAPGDALIRWGNFDRTLLLSSKVFEPDDAGRSYRLRPNA